MYQPHFGLSRKPFSSLPDPAFLYKSPQHARALTILEYAVMRDAGVTVLTGDTGCGKTTLVRHIINNQPSGTNIGLVSLLRPDSDALLPWVLYAFGLDYEIGGEVAQYDLLLNHLVDSYQEGKRSVLIVDEAHAMQDGALEEIRMISNLNVDDHPLISIILVGHTQLHKRLTGDTLAMLYQRVASHSHLGPLPAAECGRYINARMRVAGGNSAVFSADAIGLVAKSSNGVPRVINAICETSLLRAYARSAKTVDHNIVEAVVSHRADAQSEPSRQRFTVPALRTESVETPAERLRRVIAPSAPEDLHQPTPDAATGGAADSTASVDQPQTLIREPLRIWMEDAPDGQVPGDRGPDTAHLDQVDQATPMHTESGERPGPRLVGVETEAHRIDAMADSDAGYGTHEPSGEPIAAAQLATHSLREDTPRSQRRVPNLEAVPSGRNAPGPLSDQPMYANQSTHTSQKVNNADLGTQRHDANHPTVSPPANTITLARQSVESNGGPTARAQLKLSLDPNKGREVVLKVIRDLSAAGFKVLNHKIQFDEVKKQLTLKVLVNWAGDTAQIAPIVEHLPAVISVMDVRFARNKAKPQAFVTPRSSTPSSAQPSSTPASPSSSAPSSSTSGQTPIGKTAEAGHNPRQSLFGPEPI